MASTDTLSHKIKIKYGTGPNEPTAAQVLSICNAISKIIQAGRQPTERDWHTTVHLYCPSAGTCIYAGIDNSDLNTLLALALQIANSRG